MDNVFRSLLKQYTSTITALDSVEVGSDRETILLDAKDLLEEIIAYLKSYKWLYKKGSKEKIQVYLESGYDYEVLCEKCNITYDNAKSSVAWAGSQFKKKIGENTIKLIKEGYIDEARSAFYAKSGQVTVESYITPSGLEILPSPKFDIYSLESCKTELQILRLISKATFKKYEDLMDKDKMAYLLWLLEGSSRKSDLYRPFIQAILSDTMTTEELIELEPSIKAQQNYI